MSAASAVKWIFYLAGAVVVGIVIGTPPGIQTARQTRIEATAGQFPTVILSKGDRDYRTSGNTVAEFAKWGRGIGSHYEKQYPPSRIDAARQRDFYQRVVDDATEKGELDNVTGACALMAIEKANEQESVTAKKLGMKHPVPSSLLVYAERAQYFGQDSWCFLTLSTSDSQSGTARVMVVSCSPPYGLVHSQLVGAF